MCFVSIQCVWVCVRVSVPPSLYSVGHYRLLLFVWAFVVVVVVYTIAYVFSFCNAHWEYGMMHCWFGVKRPTVL